MRRRRRPRSRSNHERWLVSYADFVTLLFAFFVVMYSTSQVDQRKVGKLALAIQVGFQELGVFQPSGRSVPTAAALPFNSVQAIENYEARAALGRIVPRPEGILSDGSQDGSLMELRRELERTLAPEIQRHEVALRQDADGLVISLREVGFFDSGSADIKSDSEAAFGRMARLLAEREYRIRIEGHTDNVPIHNTRFASNWELSTARATEMIRLLIINYGFSPARLSAGGYAEFHPTASNQTEDGRAQNRRVDVVILGKVPSSPVAPTGHPETVTPRANF